MCQIWLISQYLMDFGINLKISGIPGISRESTSFPGKQKRSGIPVFAFFPRIQPQVSFPAAKLSRGVLKSCGETSHGKISRGEAETVAL